MPLFGDMMIGPFNYVQKMKNYDPNNWPKCASSNIVGSQQTFVSQMPANRQKHTEVICEFLLSIPGSITEVEEFCFLYDIYCYVFYFSALCIFKHGKGIKDVRWALARPG